MAAKLGSVYVIRASTGVVKLGMSSNPAARIRSHRAAVECWGLTITNEWVSERHDAYRKSETLLLAWASGGSEESRGEYFVGLNFSLARDAAVVIVNHVAHGAAMEDWVSRSWSRSVAALEEDDLTARRRRAEEMRYRNAHGIPDPSEVEAA